MCKNSHLFRNSYVRAVLWMQLSILTSCLNDVITKYLATELPTCQVCFFRFCFGSLALLPIGCYKYALKTTRFTLHLVRGFFLAIAMGLYCYGLAYVPMSTAIVIGFTNPIFVLILANIFLRESISWPVWLATLLSFVAIVIVFQPAMVNHCMAALACTAATVVFALLDVINKRYISREPMLALLFFSNAVAAFCIFPLAYLSWQKPTLAQLLSVGLLGIGSNLILYFLLRAFALAAVTALAPMKYTELLYSVLFGILFFNEWPLGTTYIGAACIIAANSFVAYYQNRL
ncbi:MAG: DMT family transporter [Candidatus Cardinium sp.]|nr:DMT family transporter [Candidatus Cardinium sp.]